MNGFHVALQSINACVSINLSLIFSKHFTKRCLLSIEDSLISAELIENCEIRQQDVTTADAGDLCPEHWPPLLHWPKYFPILLLLALSPFPYHL
jgi:hypothetical protein